MLPETFSELITLFDEALAELQELRERLHATHYQQLDALVCRLQEAMQEYDEQVTLDD